jgi:hypothetical protein
MGCIRKYVSWRNNQTRTMIASLKYFVTVLEELEKTKTDPEYWGYLLYRLVRMENEWKQTCGKSVSQLSEEAAAASTERQ